MEKSIERCQHFIGTLYVFALKLWERSVLECVSFGLTRTRYGRLSVLLLKEYMFASFS